MDDPDIGQQFLNHEPIPGVRFEHNDYVAVVSGQSAGKTGFLITVLELEPEPRFILELEETGFDVEVLQSQLRHADT